MKGKSLIDFISRGIKEGKEKTKASIILFLGDVMTSTRLFYWYCPVVVHIPGVWCMASESVDHLGFCGQSIPPRDDVWSSPQSGFSRSVGCPAGIAQRTTCSRFNAHRWRWSKSCTEPEKEWPPRRNSVPWVTLSRLSSIIVAWCPSGQQQQKQVYLPMCG